MPKESAVWSYRADLFSFALARMSRCKEAGSQHTDKPFLPSHFLRANLYTATQLPCSDELRLMSVDTEKSRDARSQSRIHGKDSAKVNQVGNSGSTVGDVFEDTKMITNDDDGFAD